MSDYNRDDLTLKICIFGDIGVGKTSLLSYYGIIKLEKDIGKTLGDTVSVKKLIIEGYKVTLQIWKLIKEEQNILSTVF